MKHDTTHQRLLLATVLAGALLLFWGLGTIQLLSLNEGRRALAIREMFTTGDWLLPHLNGELYLTKPPLLYWLSCALAWLNGQVSEWTLRLPSALAAAAVIGMVYRYVRRHFGAWPALYSVQLLLANASFAMLARRAEIEMLLAALCTGALLAALHYIAAQGSRRWVYLSYLLLGLAVLSKGPVALLFVTLPMLLAAMWTGDARVKDVVLDVRGWILFLLVGLSWYAAVSWQLGIDIWASIARHDMLGKMQDAHAKPILSYLGWVSVDFLFMVGIFFIYPNKLAAKFRGRIEFLLPLLAVLVPLVVFSLFSNKHEKYLLPAYPFLAILLAVQLNQLLNTARPWLRRLVLTLGVLLPALFALYYMVAEARLFHYRVAAFPELLAFSKRVPQSEFYALTDTDSRAIYYAGKPVHEITSEQLPSIKHAGLPALVLVEQDYAAAIAAIADCNVRQMQPYLKRHRALFIFGFGDACAKH